MSKNYSAQAAQMLFGKIDDMLGRVGFGIEKARAHLFSQQHKDGYWCGELEADTTLESDYIAIHTLLGTGNQYGTFHAVLVHVPCGSGSRCSEPGTRTAWNVPYRKLSVTRILMGDGQSMRAALPTLARLLKPTSP
ncbi:MAG TPA: hypothetical protein VGJ33_18905 [Candidatus Angelobacter sp.]